MNNKYPRYINLITILILDLKFSIKIGNPLWFFRELKIMKEGK